MQWGRRPSIGSRQGSKLDRLSWSEILTVCASRYPNFCCRAFDLPRAGLFSKHFPNSLTTSVCPSTAWKLDRGQVWYRHVHYVVPDIKNSYDRDNIFSRLQCITPTHFLFMSERSASRACCVLPRCDPLETASKRDPSLSVPVPLALKSAHPVVPAFVNTYAGRTSASPYPSFVKTPTLSRPTFVNALAGTSTAS